MGSETVREHIRMPREDDDRNEEASKLLVGTENARPVLTWETLMSALRRYIRTMNLDDKTRAAVEAMIRTQMKDGFLTWHFGIRHWGNFVNVRYEGPFDVLKCPIFSQVERVAVEIVQIVKDLSLTDDEKREAIEEALQPICCESWKRNDVGYTEPTDTELCTAAATAIPQVIEEAVASSFQKEVVEIEHKLIYNKKFDKSARKQILKGDMLKIYGVTGEVVGELWKTTHGEAEGKTILISVIYSNHVLYGWNKTMKQRLHNGSCAITYMKVKEDAGLIPEGTTEREYKIMLSFFIGFEGFSGDITKDNLEDGNFFFNVRKALPWTYFQSSYRPGTHALAHRVSSELHPLHIVSLMAVMGFRDFSTFFHLRTGITVPENSTFANFLSQVRRNLHNERYRESSRESNQRRKALYSELREIARTPEQYRTELQMTRLDDILVTYGSNTTLLAAICKCDRSISEDGTENNAIQRLQRIVSNRRVREYITYLGVYDRDTADAIVENSMISKLSSNAFEENDVADNFFPDDS